MHVVGVTRGRGEERASEGGGGGGGQGSAPLYIRIEKIK